jgi:hypothetical protein
MRNLIARYRQASLARRTLLSAGASAMLTAGLLGALSLGLDLASAGLRGGAGPATDDEETLASDVRASESDLGAGPVSRSPANRRSGMGSSSKLVAQNGKADEGRRAPPEGGRGDE